MGPDGVTRSERVLYHAAVVADAHSAVAPGAVLIEVDAVGVVSVLASGPCAEVEAHPGCVGARRVSLPTHAIIPALVNAHTHLDLTHVGYLPPTQDPGERFMAFVAEVRRSRATDPDAIRASVEAGIQASMEGGVVAVGDIAGAALGKPTLTAVETLGASGLDGVGFLEFFAIGSRERASRERAQGVLAQGLAHAGMGGVLGLSPHATNTVGPKTLRWSLELAAQHGLTLCTHVAESLAERALITHASGPNRAFLEELGLWTPELEGELGQGLSPIAHFAHALRVGPALNKPVRWILAHCNDASDADLDLLQGLADCGVDVTVAYCPRASAYFAASELLGPHRYRAMLDRGVNVALGTDSIINLPPIAGEEGTRLSPIWDARVLHARDGTDPRTLLAMMTTSAARALNLEEQRFTILGSQRKGPIAGLVGVDIGAGDGTASELLSRVMRSARPPELLLAGKKCGPTEH